MNIIAQNGNTGEHYVKIGAMHSKTFTKEHYANIDAVLSKTFTKEPTWTQTLTGGTSSPRSMHQIMNASKVVDSITGRNTTNEQQLPDARKHQIISFIKSGIRIVGYAFIPYDLAIATILLISSEFVGILEELV